jgi:hypothetical protein
MSHGTPGEADVARRRHAQDALALHDAVLWRSGWEVPIYKRLHPFFGLPHCHAALPVALYKRHAHRVQRNGQLWRPLCLHISDQDDFGIVVNITSRIQSATQWIHGRPARQGGENGDAHGIAVCGSIESASRLVECHVT